MKPKLMSWIVLGGAVVLLSGCYTVLKAPFTAEDLKEEPRMSKVQKAQEREWRNADEPRIGRFARDGEDRGTDMGYGYGYPVFGFGYDSQYGTYGIGMPYGYGYGYSPYNSYGYGGYGPYSYGYDPYYQGAQGFYIPPGYELVTTKELEELKASSRALSDVPVVPGPDPEELKRAEAKKHQEIWQRRVDPQSRPAPLATPRPVATGKEGDSAPKPASPPPASAAPKKVRR